jgi:hypothetical protein
MDYNSIINSTYNWLSLEKLIWFLVFFWISLPVFLLVPVGIEKGIFATNKLWFVAVLYSLIYFALIVACITLTHHCLKKKNFDAKELSITKILNAIILVFVQFWYVLVWNIHKKYRFSQLLLLFGIPLLWFYLTNLSNWFIELAFFSFLLAYFLIIIYNYIRVSFSLTYFFSNDCAVREAIKESWHMTHNKFLKVLFSYLIILVSVGALFITYVLIFGAIISLILLNYFIPPLAYNIASFVAMLIAFAPTLISYYFAYFELYSQLMSHNKSNSAIKRMLTKRVFGKKEPVKEIKRKLKKSAKKKLVKNKSSSKKRIIKKKKK